MPNPTQNFDAILGTSYSELEDEVSSIQTGKPVLYNIRSRSEVSTINLHLPPSPADSDHNEMRAPDEPRASQESRLMRPTLRGAPGERLKEPSTPQEKEVARKKSQYYQEQFAYRESNTSAKERITKDSMIMADVRTNVIVSAKFTVWTKYVLKGSRFKTNTLL